MQVFLEKLKIELLKLIFQQLYYPFQLAQKEYNQQGFRQAESCIVSFFISVTFLAIPMIL